MRLDLKLHHKLFTKSYPHIGNDFSFKAGNKLPWSFFILKPDHTIDLQQWHLAGW